MLHLTIANTATDRQRRYMAHLLDELTIANKPDPNDPRLSREAASELIDELLTIPTRRGEFNRDDDTELACWWKELPRQAHIAWILDKRRDELIQRTDGKGVRRVPSDADGRMDCPTGPAPVDGSP